MARCSSFSACGDMRRRVGRHEHRHGLYVIGAETGERGDVVGVALERRLEITVGTRGAVAADHADDRRPSPGNEGAFLVFGLTRTRRAAPVFGEHDIDLQPAGEPTHQLILELVDLRPVAVETFRPHLQPRCGIVQRDIDMHVLFVEAHAALHDVAHAELGADGRDIDRPAGVELRGLARDHAQGRHPRQVVDEVVGDAAGKPRVGAAIAALGREGKHDHRRDRLRRERRVLRADIGQKRRRAP